uniref:Legume lectin domain-containing protein n=1 Tax=Triticum urartu TaxID=4572 RepID=A0A8R7Q4Z2_TRIUA
MDSNPANGFAAVELDTVKQPYDLDDNHVGLDVNGVRSTHAASLTPLDIQLAPIDTTVNDGFYMVWVNYDGASRRARAYVAKNGTRHGVALLDAPLDLSAVLLGKQAYFDFSASTGVKYQFNCVPTWNMTVERLP